MKINSKFYDLINKEPIEIQKTDTGNIEIHSLNSYKYLYDTNIPKRRFTYWSNKGGNDYKLLIEDEFYAIMKDLYSPQANEEWLKLYNEVCDVRKKSLLTKYVPLTIVAVILMIVLYIVTFGTSYNLLSVVMVIIPYYFLSRTLTKKNEAVVEEQRSKVIVKIKEVVGEEKFEKLLDEQEIFFDEFYKKFNNVSDEKEEKLELDEKENESVEKVNENE